MDHQQNPDQQGWYPCTDGKMRYWNGEIWIEAPGAPAQHNTQPTPTDVPGRVSSFICGLFSVLLVTIPILSLPLGIVGIVQSRKATRIMILGTPGRGLAVAGQVMSICAVCVTSALMVIAIPGAWVANFG